MGTLGAVLAVVVTFSVILVAAALVLARCYASPSRASEIHRAPTRDGWLIALHRYRPASPVPGREPVLMCHGMISNRASLDLDEDVSMACFLRDAGFDVWVMELRARGESRRDPSRRGGRSLLRLGFDWSVDEFVREDLPAAVKHVLAATGAPALHWVGHSMGGMILCAHAAGGDTSWFRSAVMIDSPVHFAPLRMVTWPARLYARVIPVVPVIVFKPVFTLLYWLIPEKVLLDRLSLGKRTLLRIMHNGLLNLGSSRVLLHMSRVLADGRFRSFDRSVDYEEGPHRMTFPMMVLRASAGRIPEACVKHAYDLSPSPDRTYVRCGRGEGFSIDHNHFTLVIGREAPVEIFPLIAGWLLRHSSA